MRRWIEPAAWTAALLALSGLVVAEGARGARLAREVPLSPRELYRTLARSRTAWQVIDARPDLAASYEDAHVPGALPMPGCDPARTPAPARARIERSVPTIIVVAPEGDGALARRCRARFTLARSLAGGMDGWSGAGLPEDSGAYAPPPSRAGGGCL